MSTFLQQKEEDKFTSQDERLCNITRDKFMNFKLKGVFLDVNYFRLEGKIYVYIKRVTICRKYSKD